MKLKLRNLIFLTKIKRIVNSMVNDSIVMSIFLDYFSCLCAVTCFFVFYFSCFLILYCFVFNILCCSHGQVSTLKRLNWINK